MALGCWKSARSELLRVQLRVQTEDRGNSDNKIDYSLLGKSDILRLSSKEAQIKQFRVEVLIWKFPVQERRYKVVCLTQKAPNNPTEQN